MVGHRDPLHGDYVLGNGSQQPGALQSTCPHHALESAAPSELHIAAFVCTLVFHHNESNGT